MIVVPDSNAFHGDPRMTGHPFSIVLGRHQLGISVLVLPEVIVRELPKVFKKTYSDTHEKATNVADTLTRLGTPHPAPSETVNDAVSRFEDELRPRLKGLGVEAPALPDVTLSDLVDLAVAEQRPFEGGDKGLKDALIWQSLLELAERDEVVFITKDNVFTEDANKKGSRRLHPDLIEQLKGCGLAPDRVRLVDTVPSFIEQFVPTSTEVLRLLQQRLANDPAWCGEIKARVREELWGMQLGPHDDVTVFRSVNARPDNVKVIDAVVSDVDITAAYDTDDPDHPALELTAAATVHFSFTVGPGEMEWLRHERVDVEFDVVEETFAQGSTMAREVEVVYWADLALDGLEVGELDRISAQDALLEG